MTTMVRPRVVTARLYAAGPLLPAHVCALCCHENYVGPWVAVGLVLSGLSGINSPPGRGQESLGKIGSLLSGWELLVL